MRHTLNARIAVRSIVFVLLVDSLSGTFSGEVRAQLIREPAAVAASGGVSLSDMTAMAGANPARVVRLDRSGVLIQAARPYAVPSLAYHRIGLGLVRGQGATALMIDRLGADEFDDVQISAGISRRQHISDRIQTAVGARFSVQSFRADGYGSLSSLLAALGWYVVLDSSLTLGAYIRNAPLQGDRVATTTPSVDLEIDFARRNASVGARLTRTRGDVASFGSGVAIRLSKLVRVAAGLTSNPHQITFGVGFTFPRLDVHVAVVGHDALGTSRGLTLGFPGSGG